MVYSVLSYSTVTQMTCQGVLFVRPWPWEHLPSGSSGRWLNRIHQADAEGAVVGGPLPGDDRESRLAPVSGSERASTAPTQKPGGRFCRLAGGEVALKGPSPPLRGEWEPDKYADQQFSL